MAGKNTGRRLRAVATLCAVLAAAQLINVAPATAATDTKRPTVTITTPQDSVVQQDTPASTGGRITGRATDDVSGVEYISVEFCQAIHGPDGWSCGFFMSSGYGMATNDLTCGPKRRSCSWAVPISGFGGPMTPGVYLFTAQVTDSAGRTSRKTAPLRIIVV